MPFSSVVVNRPWDAVIDPELRPAPHPDVASVTVDEVIVLTHPAAEVALALDPLSTVLWRSFDGETSLGSLAADLVETLGWNADDAAKQLDGMCRWLGWRGFLAEPHVPEALRYDWFPALSPDDCPSRKMGLADAALLDIDLGGRRIRIGSTDDDVVAQVRAGFADRIVAADADEEREIICARIGGATGSIRSRHRVVDHWGNLLYTGRQRAVAGTTLVRVVDDRLAQATGDAIWLTTPVLLHDGTAVLVHKGLESVLDRAMPRLERMGYRLYESPYARIDAAAGELVVVDPSVPIDGSDDDERGQGITPTGRFPIASIVMGTDDLPRYEVVRALSQTAVRWDQPHLDAVDALTHRAGALGLGDDLSAPAAARAFGRAFVA